MGEKKLVPEIRFPDFKSKWWEIQLSDLFTFKNGINATKEDYGSGYKFINVLDIIQNDYITHDRIIGSVNIDEDQFINNIVEYGDILFQRSSETREEVGQTNVYLDEETPATFGGFVIRGKKKSDYSPIFMNYLLKTFRSRKEIMSKSGGSTRYNVGQETLSEVTIFTTSIPEQQKIATFLTSIDERIQLLEKKKESLEDYKKGIMQKIFSQEIRFKDEDGNDYPEWEIKRIEEVYRVTRGNVLAVPKMKQEIDNDYKYPVYSSQTVNNGLTGFYKEYLFENAITWTTDGANAGEVRYRSGQFYCTNVCGVLINDEGNSNICISELLNSVTRRYVSYVGNPKLMNKVMSKIKIPFPSVPEQQKIAFFLSSIDESIEQVKQQIVHSKTYKKGLLQKMFV